MYAEERRRQIASLTAVEGRVNVTELAERFDVTAETIRRDLAVLDKEGVVHRVHGGAVASRSFQTAEFTLDTRQRSASDAKAAIARAALDFIPHGSASIFLDAGTTINALADLIGQRYNSEQVSIVSNSLPIALSLASNGVPNVQLLGGTVRAITQAVVGDTALRTMALMRADVAFIGTNALTLDHGLSTADPQEAAIKSAFVTNAHKVVVLCDSSKLGNDYLVSFAAIGDIDVVVTDAGIPQSFIDALSEREIDVVVADE
ncbi:DeoR/GlpR family DNA-binding transcription regulator [Corynebacterium flavescens]|uniref:DeoR/GlpR family DNA-binding transcription regulator n=1 Tax=Corynebacterium flavescens TaxID=28028 RepID=UPI000EBE0668|nr:DeoR/GlpR family DNA-binding transcription regulator [Corynebacterium flavescens]MDN6098849.1 DeoR/GlpR family DNA-binding transcription regulator [Corynebacterium flavescens]MDN6199401.1 DeoR/GlpR family DNA-binding transcription regulator [Corynebacterium flavescens]MDN6226045.1 DeoR/GlpR family DNA-binding transcription regulator [Corynebacterium flavescens]MDN6236839.1 DeoR/GlpR family DNA-binding transcription regulator [Corynebacterium flavescens]MDN6430964.1 DeoR/GlpR family DNA-bind